MSAKREMSGTRPRRRVRPNTQASARLMATGGTNSSHAAGGAVQ
jgi:hypothetical protein